MKTVYILCFLLFLNNSCIERENDAYVNSGLEKVIKNYILDTKYRFVPDANVIYTVYINSRENYITIWVHTILPYYFIKTPNKFKYSFYHIEGNEVIFIVDNKQKLDDKLLSLDFVNLKEAKLHFSKYNTNIIYDGRLYFETYSFHFSDGYKFLKETKIKIGFFEDIPPEKFR